jgi:hypothetical protein
MRSNPAQPVTKSSLARHLEVPVERRSELRKTLESLVGEGVIQEGKKATYILPAKANNALAGTLKFHPRATRSFSRSHQRAEPRHRHRSRRARPRPHPAPRHRHRARWRPRPGFHPETQPAPRSAPASELVPGQPDETGGPAARSRKSSTAAPAASSAFSAKEGQVRLGRARTRRSTADRTRRRHHRPARARWWSSISKVGGRSRTRAAASSRCSAGPATRRRHHRGDPPLRACAPRFPTTSRRGPRRARGSPDPGNRPPRGLARPARHHHRPRRRQGPRRRDLGGAEQERLDLAVHIADVSHYIKPGSPGQGGRRARQLDLPRRPRAADAAARAFQRHLLAQAGRGPPHQVRGDRNLRPRARSPAPNSSTP